MSPLSPRPGSPGAGPPEPGPRESAPEAWLRGPVAAIPTPLQPVAHALIQAREELEGAVAGLGPETLWARPGGAASIGFHLRHMAGSLERLLTYARGEPLSDDQRAALRVEHEESGGDVGDLLQALERSVEVALTQLRDTPEATLDDPRTVGRDRLPSSVRGLLHHAGEHTARHAGQVATTLRVLEGGGPPDPPP